MGDPDVLSLLRNVRDYPRPGILYTDVSGALREPAVCRAFVDGARARWAGQVDGLLAVESMGFLLGGMLAPALGVPVGFSRKAGKILPDSVVAQVANSYKSEPLGLARRSFRPGDRVLVVDDVLGTGSTFAAMASLVEQLGARVAGSAHLLDLAFLPKRPEVARHAHWFLATVDRARFDALPVEQGSGGGLRSKVRSLLGR